MLLMNTEHPPQCDKAIEVRRRRLFWSVLGSLVLGMVAISCSTIDRTLVVPPSIPGATFVGTAACAECHEDVTRGFPTATHARLMVRTAGTNIVSGGCESCHGPGSLHVQAGGGSKTIINPLKNPETCFQCHLDKRGDFNLPYHHPVLEGKVTCANCHEAHKGDAILGGGTHLIKERDLCGECHIAQRSPRVFEHEAMREGCTSCHAVHGSVNAKLLHQRNGTLCLKCHFQRQTGEGLVIGGRNHVAPANFIRQGTCWSGGCHEAVHGSQVNSSLRF